MKNSNFIILFIGAFLIMGIIFMSEINFNSLATDSGFDTSYDSGGSSGGSSYGGGSYDESYSGGSSGSSGEFSFLSLVYTLVFLILIVIVMIILGFINRQLEKIHISYRVGFAFGFLIYFAFFSFFAGMFIMLFFLIPNIVIRIISILVVITIYILALISLSKGLFKIFKEGIKKEKEEARIKRNIKNLKRKSLPTTESTKEMLGYGYQIYLDVQKAWMNFDYDTMRKLVTDELFNMYQTQLQSLEVKEQQNIMSDFKHREMLLVSLETENDVTIAKMLLKVSFYDYIVNKEGKVVRGKKSKNIVMTYLLTFVSSQKVIENCPHCGAKLENDSSICTYCNTTLQISHQMKLAKKEVLEQESD